jgi:thiol-disulfide isomerase/thioredoxin
MLKRTPNQIPYMKYLSLLFLLPVLVALNASASTKLMADTSLNKPAPDFKLKDMQGKSVSLADYKGKTLIIDFWATWCVPCRNSFPATKIAIEKYKDDPNVKFLFIDTRETDADYQQQVKKFLADNNYPFYTIFDEKSDDGKMNATYKKFVMPGIPTKYFIDGNGIIRYKMVGYIGELTAAETAAEIESIIEKVKIGK